MQSNAPCLVLRLFTVQRPGVLAADGTLTKVQTFALTQGGVGAVSRNCTRLDVLNWLSRSLPQHFIESTQLLHFAYRNRCVHYP